MADTEVFRSIPFAVVFCHGSYHRPEHFQPAIDALRARGVEAVCPRLPTCSIADVSAEDSSNPVFDSPPPRNGWPDGQADVGVIRSAAKRFSDAGKKVVLGGHSYGGWLATEVAKAEYHDRPERPGICGIFFLSGMIVPLGQSIDSTLMPEGSPVPEMVMLHAHGKDGLVTPIRSDEFYYNDLPPAEAKHWSSLLVAQPPPTTTLTHDGYLQLPCAYLLCESDKMLPFFVQEMMVKGAVDQGGNFKIYRCPSGHAPMLSWTEGVADSLKEFGLSASASVSS